MINLSTLKKSAPLMSVLIATAFVTTSVQAQAPGDGYYRKQNTPAVYRISGNTACSVTFDQMNGVGWDKVRDISTNPAAGRQYINTCRGLPIRKKKLTELGDHRHMESEAVLSTTGRIDVTTRIWTDKQMSGFTGGVVIRFLDGAGNIVGATGVHSWGVDGRRIPGSPSDRTQVWTDPVPSDLLKNVVGIEIVQTTDPKDLANQVNRAVGIACGAARTIYQSTQYCKK